MRTITKATLLRAARAKCSVNDDEYKYAFVDGVQYIIKKLARMSYDKALETIVNLRIELNEE